MVRPVIDCPVCECPAAAPRFRASDRFFETAAGEFQLYRCAHCGSLFQDQAEIGARLAEFYPAGYWWRRTGAAGRWERLYRETMLRHDQLRFVMRAAGLVPGRRWLDIGCGPGTLVSLAVRRGLDAFGLEQCAEALHDAPPELARRVFTGTEQDLIRRGEEFDLLTLFHSLEHMTRPFHYLKSLQHLLRRPGGLIVQVPNLSSWQARLFGRRWYGLDCPRHVCNYTMDALLLLLDRAGYQVERIRHFSLRDNAAALVSSLFPGLDPMSQRVKLLRRTGRLHSRGLAFKEVLYLALLGPAQAWAVCEAACRRGASIAIYATVRER
jgi:cyclopropane fatty-acyl-phospholipid synthase-like methyltransferase